MKRQVTVATLMVSSIVMLSSCVADIGTRSASEETTKVDVSGGNSSADGAGGANGDPGDDADGDRGESALAADEKDAEGAGHPGEAGAPGPGTSPGVLPPLGEFDPADPNFELFDPCMEIPDERKERLGLRPKALDYRRDSGSTFCNFESNGTEFPLDVLISFASDSNPIRALNLKEELRESSIEADSRAVQVFRSELFENSQCDGYVSTVQGTVIVGVNNIGLQTTTEERCRLAVSLMNQFR